MAKKIPNFSMDKTKKELDMMGLDGKKAERKKILSYKNNSNGVNRELGPPKKLPPKSPFTQVGQFNVKQNTSGASNYDEWPLAKYSFEVNIGGFDGKISFQAMDGLGASVGKMEFRDGNSSKFYKQHRPTLTSYDPCTLKKGVFQGDSVLFDWFNNVSTGSMFSDMRTVSIHLCEHSGDGLNHLFTWTLEKAYVTKYTPSGLDGEADTEIAIEEIEISYQAFSLTAGEGGLLGSLLGAVTGGLGGLGGAISGAISGSLSF